MEVLTYTPFVATLRQLADSFAIIICLIIGVVTLVSANANARPMLQPLLNILPSFGPQVLHIFINHLPFEWLLNSNITFTVPLSDPSKILANQISQTLTPKYFTTTFRNLDVSILSEFSILDLVSGIQLSDTAPSWIALLWHAITKVVLISINWYNIFHYWSLLIFIFTLFTVLNTVYNLLASIVKRLFNRRTKKQSNHNQHQVYNFHIQGLSNIISFTNERVLAQSGKSKTTFLGFIWKIVWSPFRFCNSIILWIFRLFQSKPQGIFTINSTEYRLRDLDFTNRKTLLTTLIPQIRLVQFNANTLFQAIVEAGNRANWSELAAFRSARPQIIRTSHLWSFLNFMLRWNVPNNIYDEYCQQAYDKALTFKTPVKTYQELLHLLREIDALPYLRQNFNSVMGQLLQTAFLHKPVFKVINQIYRETKSYWDFCHIFDSSFYDLIPPTIKGKPSRRPLVRHFLRNGLSHYHRQPTTKKTIATTTPIVAAAINPTAPDSYFVSIALGDTHPTETIGYLDQGSSYSFISPALVESLQLAPTVSYQCIHVATFGQGIILIEARRVQLSFQLQGFNNVFEFSFIVHDSLISPILLGNDFWKQYEVLCLPGQRLELQGKPITTIPAADHQIIFSTLDLEITPEPTPDAFKELVNHFKTKKHKLTLPPRREDDYKIEINRTVPIPLNRPIPKYTMAAEKAIIENTEELLYLGMIEPSSQRHYSIPSAVPKKNGTHRIVYDFRGINSITIPLKSTWRHLRELLPGITGSSIFSTIDLSSAYHQLRIHPATSKWTTFITPTGKYQFKVLPFGLNDAPEVFGRYMKNIFNDMPFVRTYLDDILVFSSTTHQHYHHLKLVLQRLADRKHTVNWEKSEFGRSSIQWVGHTLSSEGILPLDTTIGQIQQIGTPRTKEEVQQFLGHVAYIQDHIPRYSHRAAPLTDLLIKNRRFDWSTRCQQAFLDLKSAVANAVTLQVFDPNKPIAIFTDASKVATAAILMQPDFKNINKWRPIEYRSMKFNPSQANWDIHLKEFYAIKVAMNKFRHFIEGKQFTLHVDQLPIVQIFENYGVTKTPVDPRIQRWMSKLLSYNFEVIHIPGSENYIADHMSRNPTFTISPKTVAVAGSINVVKVPADWYAEFRQAYLDDPDFSTTYTALTSDNSHTQSEFPDFKLDDTNGLLFYKDKLCIPKGLLSQFFLLHHSSPIGGHLGSKRLHQQLKDYYFFPKMATTIEEFTKSCIPCQKNKHNNSANAGLLQSLPPPKGRWTDINVDLITGYPEVEYLNQKVNAILTIVCRFTRRVNFYAISSKFAAIDFTNLFTRFYMPLHGIPETITTDRGTQFTAEIFQKTLKLWNIQSRISVTNHQQSNGLAETKNKEVEKYLRLFIQYQTDWPQLLPTAEFVLNAAPSKALGNKSPFEVDLSYIPKSPNNLLFPIEADAYNSSAIDITEELDRLTSAARTAHKAAFENDKRYYDQRHRHVTLKVGDEVFINNKYLKTHLDGHNLQLPPKLRSLFSGPFEVLEISPNLVNCTLAMPPSFKGDPTFHISQVRAKNSLPEEFLRAPEPEIAIKKYKDDSTLVEIVAILNHFRARRGYRLTVRHRPTGEHPEGELGNYTASSLQRTAPDLLRDYARKHNLPILLNKESKV